MVKALPKIILAGVIIIGFRNGINELARGVDVPAEHVSYRGAALKTALPAEKHGCNFLFLSKIFAVDDRAGVYYDDNFLEKLAGFVYKVLFNIRKVVVAVYRSAVNALSGKAAYGDNRRVSPVGCGFYNAVGNLGLFDVHARKGVIGHVVTFFAELHGVDDIPCSVYLCLSGNVYAFSFNIFPVEVNKRHIDGNFSFVFLLFEAVKYVADIRCVDIAASAASLYVFDSSFAEKSNPCAFFQR